MVWNGTKSIAQVVDEIVADGKMTRREKIELEKMMMADGRLDEEEKEQIRRLMDMMADGELQVVDE